MSTFVEERAQQSAAQGLGSFLIKSSDLARILSFDVSDVALLLSIAGAMNYAAAVLLCFCVCPCARHLHALQHIGSHRRSLSCSQVHTARRRRPTLFLTISSAFIRLLSLGHR